MTAAIKRLIETPGFRYVVEYMLNKLQQKDGIKLRSFVDNSFTAGISVLI